MNISNDTYNSLTKLYGMKHTRTLITSKQIIDNRNKEKVQLRIVDFLHNIYLPYKDFDKIDYITLTTHDYGTILLRHNGYELKNIIFNDDPDKYNKLKNIGYCEILPQNVFPLATMMLKHSLSIVINFKENITSHLLLHGHIHSGHMVNKDLCFMKHKQFPCIKYGYITNIDKNTCYMDFCNNPPFNKSNTNSKLLTFEKNVLYDINIRDVRWFCKNIILLFKDKDNNYISNVNNLVNHVDLCERRNNLTISYINGNEEMMHRYTHKYNLSSPGFFFPLAEYNVDKMNNLTTLNHNDTFYNIDNNNPNNTYEKYYEENIIDTTLNMNRLDMPQLRFKLNDKFTGYLEIIFDCYNIFSYTYDACGFRYSC